MHRTEFERVRKPTVVAGFRGPPPPRSEEELKRRLAASRAFLTASEQYRGFVANAAAFMEDQLKTTSLSAEEQTQVMTVFAEEGVLLEIGVRLLDEDVASAHTLIRIFEHLLLYRIWWKLDPQSGEVTFQLDNLTDMYNRYIDDLADAVEVQEKALSELLAYKKAHDERWEREH